jgi:hypothetical protein
MLVGIEPTRDLKLSFSFVLFGQSDMTQPDPRKSRGLDGVATLAATLSLARGVDQ